MKLLTLTGISLAVAAIPALAQSSIDAVTAQLQAEGFTHIEVEVTDSTIEIEGSRAGQEREMVFDAATWALLSDETHADLDADDDDGDDDGDDEDLDDVEDADDSGSDDDDDQDDNDVEDGDGD